MAYILYILGLCFLILPNLLAPEEPFAFFFTKKKSRLFGILCIIPIFLFNYFKLLILSDFLIPLIIVLTVIFFLFVYRCVLGWKMLGYADSPWGRASALKKFFSSLEGIFWLVCWAISIILIISST